MAAKSVTSGSRTSPSGTSNQYKTTDNITYSTIHFKTWNSTQIWTINTRFGGPPRYHRQPHPVSHRPCFLLSFTLNSEIVPPNSGPDPERRHYHVSLIYSRIQHQKLTVALGDSITQNTLTLQSTSAIRGPKFHVLMTFSSRFVGWITRRFQNSNRKPPLCSLKGAFNICTEEITLLRWPKPVSKFCEGLLPPLTSRLKKEYEDFQPAHTYPRHVQICSV